MKSKPYPMSAKDKLVLAFWLIVLAGSIGGGLFVEWVKFMAYWRVAFR